MPNKVESRAMVGGSEARRASHAAGAAVVLALALLLGGCGGGAPDSAENTDSAKSTDRAGSTKSKDSTDGAGRSNDSGRSTPSPTPTASPSPARTPSSAPNPTATPESPRNGRNLDACRDRRCEVEVRAGDTIEFAPKYESNAFTISYISSGQVGFTATDQAGAFRGALGGTGSVQTGDVRIDFVGSVEDGRGIIEISPR